MQSYKRIIARNTKLVEVVASNLQPVISNRVIIMNLVLNVINKYTDNIMIYFGKRFKCFGVC